MEIINYVGTGASHAMDKTMVRYAQKGYSLTETAHTSTASRDRTQGAARNRTIYRPSTGLIHTTPPRDTLRERTATLSTYRGTSATLDRTGAGLKDRTATLSTRRTGASLSDRTSLGLRSSSIYRPLASSKDRTLSALRTGVTPMSDLLKGEKTASSREKLRLPNDSALSSPSKTVTPTRATMSVMNKEHTQNSETQRAGAVLSREMIKNVQEIALPNKKENSNISGGTLAFSAIAGALPKASSSAARAKAISPLAFAGRAADAFRRVLGSAAAFAIAAVAGSILVMGADWYASHTGPLALQDGSTTELDALSFIMQCSGVDNVTDTINHIDGSIRTEGLLTSHGVDELNELAKAAVPVIKSVVTWQTYTVSPGDTIIGLTRRFGLENISTIIAVNGVDNARAIRAGQKLRIPSMDGLVYTVKAGNTLEGISSKYSVSMEDMLDVNDLSSKDLAAGQELFIPGAAMDSSALREVMGDLMKCPIKTSYRISSHFGWRADPFTGVRSYHSGVDMACPMGTPIYAAMGGKVITAGWSNVFGNYVIVDHRNGYQSLYGHMSKRIAVKGQIVNQGDRLGLVGSTGYSTGPHLHFTVYKKGHLTDPLALLRR